MTLREQIESDIASVFLNTDDLAEACTYYPRAGGAREIVCDVQKSVQMRDEPTGLVRKEVVSVWVSKSATTGIDKPQIGDALKLSGDDKLFAYAGEPSEEDEFSWTLTFERFSHVERGGNRQAR